MVGALEKRHNDAGRHDGGVKGELFHIRQRELFVLSENFKQSLGACIQRFLASVCFRCDGQIVWRGRQRIEPGVFRGYPGWIVTVLQKTGWRVQQLWVDFEWE